MEDNFKPLVPYWYNVGDVINGLEVLEQTYVVDTNGWRKKAYIVKCLKCNYIYDHPKSENNLKKYGCEVCNGKKVVQGINDIKTTHPWMVKYFKNPEEANNFTYCSNKKRDMICPECMKIEKKIAPRTLYENGFRCNFCDDGISYPEKFIMNFLDMLNIDFVTQLSKRDFQWCKEYRYDFYIPQSKTIIETHGRQHYEECNLTKRTLSEEQSNDKIKRELALSNGIIKYIELDCRESNMGWIKDSILKSDLLNILNITLENVNWIEVEAKSLKSNIFTASKLWNENLEFTTEDIGKILHLSSASIKKYLEKGCKIGICDYTPKKGKYRRDLKKIGKPSVNSMKIYYDGLIYDSIKEFSEQIGQGQMAVGRWLRGECRPKNKQKEIYLSAHYATDDEICRFPKFRDCVKQQEIQNQGSLLLCSNE